MQQCAQCCPLDLLAKSTRPAGCRGKHRNDFGVLQANLAFKGVPNRYAKPRKKEKPTLLSGGHYDALRAPRHEIARGAQQNQQADQRQRPVKTAGHGGKVGNASSGDSGEKTALTGLELNEKKMASKKQKKKREDGPEKQGPKNQNSVDALKSLDFRLASGKGVVQHAQDDERTQDIPHRVVGRRRNRRTR